MNCRHLTVKCAAVLVVAFTMLACGSADARQCGRFDRSRGGEITFKCPPEWGRGAAAQRRHFREAREARGRVVSHRLSARMARAVGAQTDNDGRIVFAGPAVEPGRPAARQSRRGATKPVRLARAAQEARQPVSVVTSQILPHPDGCPRRAFCGCGAALKVFGRHVRSLWLAANWLRFPPAAPAPGMVAARRGHVFVIEAVVGNGRVLAYDANSGRGKTRHHVRSLAGYSVRNPNSG